MRIERLKTEKRTYEVTDRLYIVAHLLDRAKELGSQQALAAEIGISKQYLNDIIHLQRLPSAKVCRQIGVTAKVIYVVSEDVQ